MSIAHSRTGLTTRLRTCRYAIDHQPLIMDARALGGRQSEQGIGVVAAPPSTEVRSLNGEPYAICQLARIAACDRLAPQRRMGAGACDPLRRRSASPSSCCSSASRTRRSRRSSAVVEAVGPSALGDVGG